MKERKQRKGDTGEEIRQNYYILLIVSEKYTKAIIFVLISH